MSDAGPDLEAYLHDLGWAIERSNSVVVIPPNPDNQIEATVVQESIKLPRKSVNRVSRRALMFRFLSELAKIISHSALKA